MLKKRFSNDYRLKNTSTPSGKIKTIAVYCGEYYTFAADALTIRKTKRLLPTLTVICTLLFYTTLFLNTPILRLPYVLLPVIACMPALLFLCAAVFCFCTVHEPFTRADSSKIYNRLVLSSAAIMVLSGLSLVSAAAGYLSGAFHAEGQEALFCVLQTGFLLSDTAIFTKKNNVKTRPIET